MNQLVVNSYINEAENALHNDPEYQRLFDSLVDARKELMENNGCTGSRIEGILFEMWQTKIGYILDNREKIESGFGFDPYKLGYDGDTNNPF